MIAFVFINSDININKAFTICLIVMCSSKCVIIILMMMGRCSVCTVTAAARATHTLDGDVLLCPHLHTPTAISPGCASTYPHVPHVHLGRCGGSTPATQCVWGDRRRSVATWTGRRVQQHRKMDLLMLLAGAALLPEPCRSLPAVPEWSAGRWMVRYKMQRTKKNMKLNSNDHLDLYYYDYC